MTRNWLFWCRLTSWRRRTWDCKRKVKPLHNSCEDSPSGSSRPSTNPDSASTQILLKRSQKATDCLFLKVWRQIQLEPRKKVKHILHIVTEVPTSGFSHRWLAAPANASEFLDRTRQYRARPPALNAAMITSIERTSSKLPKIHSAKLRPSSGDISACNFPIGQSDARISISWLLIGW